MSKFLKLREGTPEQKFEHLEVILKRLSRRIHKVITVAFPPSPIFGYCETPAADGSVVRCVFPAPGHVTRICMAVSNYADNKKVAFQAEFAKYDGSQIFTRTFETRKSVEIANIDLHVGTGDCMTLKVETPAEGEEFRASNIWTSVLYVIDMPEGRIQEISFDELDKLIEEGMEEDERVLGEV